MEKLASENLQKEFQSMLGFGKSNLRPITLLYIEYQIIIILQPMVGEIGIGEFAERIFVYAEILEIKSVPIMILYLEYQMIIFLQPMVGEIGVGEFAERISGYVGAWEIKSVTYYAIAS